MAIDVRCRKCGKAYKLRDERAGSKIRCKECQAVIAVPEAAHEEDYGEYGDDAWAEPAQSSPPPKRRSAAKKTTKKTATATSVAGFTLRKIFGVLALLLARVMCLGILMQLSKGNFRALSALLAVAGVGGVGMKWLRT